MVIAKFSRTGEEPEVPRGTEPAFVALRNAARQAAYRDRRGKKKRQ